MIKGKAFTYSVMWSEKDSEYVGKCAEYPNLSFLNEDPIKALSGIKKLISDMSNDLELNWDVIS